MYDTERYDPCIPEPAYPGILGVLRDLPFDHPLIEGDPENVEWNEAFAEYLREARDAAGEAWFLERSPRWAA